VWTNSNSRTTTASTRSEAIIIGLRLNLSASKPPTGPKSAPSARAKKTSPAFPAEPVSWFIQTPTGLVANPTRAWKLRLAGGRGFALIRVERIDNESSNPSPTDGMAGIKIGFRLQPTDGSLGTLDSVVVAIDPGSSAVINLSTKAVTPSVMPQDCSWDLRVTRAYELVVNTSATCDTGTFPLAQTDDFTALTTAADAPQYAPFISQVSGPIPTTFDDPAGPFLYGIDPANPQRLYPTFNVYLVKVGSAVYKVQLTGYYSETGASGHPTIRYAKLR